MANVIKIKRGNKANLASAGVEDGELKYTKDTKELFIGDGEENVKIGGNPLDFPVSTATQIALNLKLDKSKIGLINLTSATGYLTDEQLAEAQKEICIISDYNGNLYYKYSESNPNILFVSLDSHVSANTNVRAEFKRITINISTKYFSTESAYTDLNIYNKTEDDALLLAKQDKNNLVSVFQATPDDTHYPSEKLVKDNLDNINAKIPNEASAQNKLADKKWVESNIRNFDDKFDDVGFENIIFETSNMHIYSYYMYTIDDEIYHSCDGIDLKFNKSEKKWLIQKWNGHNRFSGEYMWNDLDNNAYYSRGTTHYVLNKETNTWETKTWNGLTDFDGFGIWTDGENIYYSSGGTAINYVLDKATDTWTQKTWTGLTKIFIGCLWTDGENIYHSEEGNNYILNKETSTWETKVWYGLTNFQGGYVWTDGKNIYYSSDSPKRNYVLNKDTSTWETKTWTGLTNLNGFAIWTDGKNTYYSLSQEDYILENSNWKLIEINSQIILQGRDVWKDLEENYYYSSNTLQYVLDFENLKCYKKVWYGNLSSFYGRNIWTDGDNIYHSNATVQNVLNTSTSSWNSKSWGGITNFNGQYIWTDGDNIYYSYPGHNWVLDKTTDTWNTKTWSGLSNIYGSYVWAEGTNIYYSYGDNQYVLDKATSTWNKKTWNGLNYFDGYNIWKKDNNIYYSNRENHYLLDVENGTWETKTWNGNTKFEGQSVVNYKGKTYCLDSYYQNGITSSNQVILKSLETATTYFHTHLNKDVLDKIDIPYTSEKEKAIQEHLFDTSNPHNVTKAQVGLGNCDNTSDIDKPVSTAQQTALNLKVDKSQIGYVELLNTSGTLTEEQLNECEKNYCILKIQGIYYYKRFVNDNKIYFIKPWLDKASYSDDSEQIRQQSIVITTTTSEYVYGYIEYIRTFSYNKINTLLNAKQDTIDSDHKLDSDLVDDTNQTHKFATSAQLTQIGTNQTDIANIKDGTTIDSFADVESAIQSVRETAEGKCANYIIADDTTGTNIVNTSFNSTATTVAIDIKTSGIDNNIKDVDNNLIKLSDLHKGDIISITDLEVPDRWVGSITSTTVTFYYLETKLNIDSSVTSGSANPVSSDAVYNYSEPKISSSHKISADNVDDANTTNKFVSATEKATWNGKQDAINSSNKLSADLVSNGTSNMIYKSVSGTDLEEGGYTVGQIYYCTTASDSFSANTLYLATGTNSIIKFSGTSVAVDPAILTFTVSPTSTELGNKQTVTYTYTLKKASQFATLTVNDGTTPTSLTPSASGSGTFSGTYDSATFTLSGTATGTTIASKNAYISAQYRYFFYGTTEANVSTVLSSLKNVTTSSNTVYTALSKPSSFSLNLGSTNQYVYFVVPSSSSINSVKSGGFDVPYSLIGSSYSFTNSYNATYTVKVYRTDSKINGSLTFNIT